MNTVLDDDRRIHCAESFMKPGFTAHVSDEGVTYYYNQETNTSQWDRPDQEELYRVVDGAPRKCREEIVRRWCSQRLIEYLKYHIISHYIRYVVSLYIRKIYHMNDTNTHL